MPRLDEIHDLAQRSEHDEASRRALLEIRDRFVTRLALGIATAGEFLELRYLVRDDPEVHRRVRDIIAEVTDAARKSELELLYRRHLTEYLGEADRSDAEAGRAPSDAREDKENRHRRRP